MGENVFVAPISNEGFIHPTTKTDGKRRTGTQRETMITRHTNTVSKKHNNNNNRRGTLASAVKDPEWVIGV